jgi:hypothetical protein
MQQDDHQLTFEARTYADGLSNMFSNMDDAPLEGLQPFEMVLLLQPVIDRLNRVLGDRPVLT